jgi:hypothetical protein
MLNLTIAFTKFLGKFIVLIMKAIRNAVKLVLIFLVFLAGILPLLTSTANAQGKKPTATSTVTRTSTLTPSVTPTESLNVFETPSTPTADPLAIYISNPLEGSVISGVVEIRGKTEIIGFTHQEVGFSYQENPTNTWFLLSKSDQGVKDGPLALWDTNAISDGDYSIRVRVFFSDGSWRDALVTGIKVRNYTATQTRAPTNTQETIPTSLPTKTITPTQPLRATPSLFPANAAELPSSKIVSSLGRGAAVTALLFLIFGLLLRSRKKSL